MQKVSNVTGVPLLFWYVTTNCVRNALTEPLCPAPSLKVTVAWVALLKASMCTVPGPAPLGGTTGGGTIAVAKALEKLSASPRPASRNDFMAHPPAKRRSSGKGPRCQSPLHTLDPGSFTTRARIKCATGGHRNVPESMRQAGRACPAGVDRNTDIPLQPLSRRAWLLSG